MAALVVTNTSLNQREKLLPSEKAYAYKMQLNALNHQGKSTSGQIGSVYKVPFSPKYTS
jgi:ParB family chromosome partitioning protein